MADEDATQEEVDAALVDLGAAIEGLDEAEKVELEVLSVSAIDDIEVAFNSEEELELPTEVTITLNDEDETEEILAVDWEENEDYDVTVPGEYTFVGTIEYPEDAEYVVSEEFETVEAVVTVLEPTEEQVTAAVTAVRTANAAGMIKALQNPVLVYEGLEGVDEDLGAEYHTKINANQALVTSVARIQQYVDLVNKEEADDLQELIDAVNDAVADLDLTALATALNNAALGLKNVSTANFDAEYLNALDEATTETKPQIQAVIDTVNLEEITAAVVKAETELTAALHTAAGTLVNLDLLEEEVQDDFTARLVKVDLVVKVNTAGAAYTSDETALVTALNNALELSGPDAILPDTTNNPYGEAFADKDAGFKFKNIDEIEAFVAEVKAGVEKTAFETALGTLNALDGSDADALLAALKDNAFGDVKDSVIDAFKDDYAAALVAILLEDATFEFETVENIQEFVDDVNLEETIAAVNTLDGSDADALLAALKDSTNKILKLENIADKNKAIYASELVAILEDDSTFEFETVADIQAFVDDVNATPIGKVNTAKNTTEMLVALENPELELDLAVFNLLPELDQAKVAQAVRAGNATGFADAEAVQTALDNAIGAL